MQRDSTKNFWEEIKNWFWGIAFGWREREKGGGLVV